jgi:hypothetical protein
MVNWSKDRARSLKKRARAESEFVPAISQPREASEHLSRAGKRNSEQNSLMRTIIDFGVFLP